MGLVNDQHNLMSTFVLCKQGTMESVCQRGSVRGDRIEAKFPAYHLYGIVEGAWRIPEMDHFVVLQVVMGEYRVDQEGFPTPGSPRSIANA